MDKVHEGWLTKSPPDWKKHVSIFKLKKWRRRYFVLYSPPDSCIVPGTCDAQLCYYENDSLSKECGRIDLKNCEEIISQLETDDFKNVLALKTAFRNQSRTYYLAADTEEDLDRWMDKISYVLNVSGDEFIEISQKEEVENRNVPCRSKPESKAKGRDKPRTKLSGVSLRRSSSSTLSKSSTSINLLAGKQTPRPAPTPHFSPSSAGKYQKLSVSQNDGFSTPAGDNFESETSLTRSTNIRNKPSFLNKIKQLKPQSRRPSCPIILPPANQCQPCDDPILANVLRPSASKQGTPRFQGSSGSSIMSFNSDYKTPDISSPTTMPSLFYLKKIENKLSRISNTEPPPLPPKVRSSDSGLPDENNSMTCPIYDVPAHNYGSYKGGDDDDDNDDPGFIKDRLMELEGMARFEGVCLSVVDEREDEGLENDRCPSIEERRTFDSIPPPLPERRKVCPDKNSRNSSDSEYDVLPFARRLQLQQSAKLEQTKAGFDDDDDSDDSDGNYDILPVRRYGGDDLEPPPLPERKKLDDTDLDIDLDRGTSRGDRSSDSVDDSINDSARLSDDDILSKFRVPNFSGLQKVQGARLAELCSQLAKNPLLPRNRLLIRMKSKSLENIKEKDTTSDFSTEESRKSNVGEDEIVRMTVKTRSFKRKSDEKSSKYEESISSLGSSSNPSDENPEALVVNDDSVFKSRYYATIAIMPLLLGPDKIQYKIKLEHQLNVMKRDDIIAIFGDGS